MSRASDLAKKLLAGLLSVSIVFSGPLHAALTDIADYPITQPATASLNPNLLLILDDSGSMARQFSPDYVSPTSVGSSNRNCFDSYDTNNDITTTLEHCGPGDPPAMAPEFNTQYYNPEIRYLPAVNYDGSQRANMTCANTGGTLQNPGDDPNDPNAPCVGDGGWTAVPTDNVSAPGANQARKDLTTGQGAPHTNWDTGTNPVIYTYNVRQNWPDRVWCKTAGDTNFNDPSRCRTNSAYTYPNFEFGYGRDPSGNVKYKFGAPYYYRIIPTEYCTDARLNNCVTSDGPTVVDGVSYSVPAPVRFCANATLTDCSAKRSSTRRYPKFAGRITTAGSGALRASARITVANPQPDTAQGNVLSIVATKPGGATFTVVAGTITLPANASANTWAETIANAITTYWSTSPIEHRFAATRSGNVVTITVPHSEAGAAWNGGTLTLTHNVTGQTPAWVEFTFTNTVRASSGSGVGRVDSLVIEGHQFVPSTISCTHPECNSPDSATRNNRMAAIVRAALNPPAGWVVSGSGNVVRITAPSLTGSEKNGTAAAISAANTTATGSNGSRLANGVTVGDVVHTVIDFTGGADPTTSASRVDVGTFVRTDIVPGRTYNKYPNRTDCVAQEGVCTYAEEMTNFANWFAYYRTRIQAAKTAIGRAIALAAIPDNWRLGFKTINFAASRYLPVAPFTSGAGGHRQQWYQKLYEAPAASGTPLRLALSRAGRYFGNRNPDGMGPTPINSACQPNFVILTSDGYWNDSGTVAQKLDGSAIGDADGDGYANTLADVAYYYYHTDLMPSLPNQVPAAGIDNAPHQHMTTFTVGMGIEGTLLFHPNYLERGNSLDYDAITDGNPATTPNNWPQPVADTETAVDDMWHAAVNGRGRFFSVRDPEALANGINQVLTAIAQRVGAGAAAATSNLQPVAGDNFAFTAQYTTVEWSGDLKARTIRLTDGLISGRELWSASALLDQRSHTDRRIYTFDPADTVPGAVITVNGASRVQNGNRLRSFCSHTDAALPTCDDGGLLTPQEANDYFNPLGGPNGALSQTAGWPSGDPRRVAATPGSLIRYLRGDAANEIALGGTSSTDLYRNRAHLLGDIVNAQPAYVKAAPFNYSPTTDPYYLDFKNRTNGTAGTRKGTVYVAANDGMLHAFETDPDNNPYYQTAGIENPDTNPGNDAFTGTLNTDPITGEGAERWAYIPTLVFPTLKRLAEANYSSNHRFFVDGSPAVGDVCFGHTLSTPCASVNNWRTILVAGLNAGGRGYYALDITDPDNPKGLWELKGGSGAACLTDAQANSGEYGEDCNIGLTFGNPIIAKRPEDGRWVVFVTSGYNNVSPGDGKGYLYIVDAQTGKILRRMSTGLGSTGTPSGLGRINAWVDQATVNNTARAVYGGDLQGNVWRFQLEEQASPAIPRYSVTKLATVYDPSNNPQPITAKPELAEVAGKRVVVIGTGRFLGASDKTDNQRQSIYAIKDDLAGAGDSTPFNDPPQVNMTRSSPTTIPGFVRQELTENSTSTRIATNNPVDFTAHHGWFIDLPGGGSGGEAAERVNIDPSVQLGTLVVASNVPSNETCVAGGYGWVNFLNVASGATVATGVSGTPASVKIAASLIVGINVVKIGEQVKTVVTTADNQQITEATPTVPSGVQGRRVSWREVFVE